VTLVLAQGFHPPITEEFRWPCLIDLKPGGVNLCINRPIILGVFAALAVGALFYGGVRKPQLVPAGLQNYIEAAADFVRRELIFAVIGPEGMKFWPYITTLFWFVFVCNVFEVIPLINFPVTFRSAYTWTLAILSLMIFVSVGVIRQGPWSYLKAVMFPPGAPKPVYVLIAPIEFVSTFFVRPFTLSIRLLANMIAGHAILIVFWFGTAYLLQPAISAAFAVVPFALSVLLVGFEIVIATLQAYVFAILTSIYIAGAISAEGH
jgi:F-type H+-transporting ATPase subunit a